MVDKVNLHDKLALIDEPWRPKVIADLNGQEVKLAKLQGAFVWHLHEAEDELFFCIEGRMRVELRDRVVELAPGELFVVPRGVEHRTASDEGASALVITTAGVRNTGNVEHPTLTAPSGARL